MKFRSTLFIAIIALFLAACNMTLAEDVTPPPGAVQPAPAQPTMGPVFPAQAPNLEVGAAIYIEKCAPCHGESGMGDGPQAEQLPVPVAALGQPEVAAQASPADWYQIVTLGNMDNFMPPFSSLSDQERWDVVAYAQSLSRTPEQVSQGEKLFNENCADCPTDFFSDQEEMAALSTNELVSMLSEGGEGLPALGESLSEDELVAVADYLRTLSLDASSLAAQPASATETGSEPAEEPSAAGTPTGGEQAETTPEAASAVSVTGPVNGTLVNGSGGDIPAGASVTLHGFDHASSASGTPEEVVTETTTTDADGAFTFDDVDLAGGRIFLVEASYKDVVFQSDLAVSEAGANQLTIPDVTVYDNTTDSSGLVVEQLHVSFDMAVEGGVQVFELFTISNLSDKAYVFATDGTSLPFVHLPEGATDVGLQLSQDSAPLMPTEGGDFAIPPSEDFYSIIAFFSMPYDRSLDLKQTVDLPVSSALVIVPEGIKVKSDQLTDQGIQQTQQGFNVQMYSTDSLSAGTPLEIALSGKVNIAGTATVGSRQTLLIGAGTFGVILILAGVWMFLRDREEVDEDDFEDADGEAEEFETPEEVMDAIIALDDLHRAKKIPDEAYQLRREELKERLKELA
jgi:mono/diheme cytochrome c family protein